MSCVTAQRRRVCKTRPVGVNVRQLKTTEWSLWRDLRLRAVRDSPDAFRATLDEELARQNSDWADIIRATVEHPRGTLLVAEVQNEPIGMIFGRIDAMETCAEVGAMWVNPTARGAGAGGALLDAAISWAADYGVSRLELWVTDGNAAAGALYSSRGLSRTGATEFLREGSTRTISKWACDIDERL